MHIYLNVILLAILQGIAEFLPISSSGHLVIAAKLLNFSAPGVRFDMMLHFGTLLAVCLYFRRDLTALSRALMRRERQACLEVGYLLLATLPAVIFYFLAKNWVESFFENARFAAQMLLVTGCLLLSLSLRRKTRSRPLHGVEKITRPVNFWRALAIGIAQAIALFPGISRSGATIVTARHFGIEPKRAATFSFLMSIPPLLGGAILTLLTPDLSPVDSSDMGWDVMGLGMAVAACVGYFAITVLMRTLIRGRFWVFGLYCILAGSLVLISGI